MGMEPIARLIRRVRYWLGARRHAAELVCEGPVCVTRTQQARLADLADPGRKALSLMRGALGGQVSKVHSHYHVPVSSTGAGVLVLEGAT